MTDDDWVPAWFNPTKAFRGREFVVLCGGRGAGKTTLILDICYRAPHIFNDPQSSGIILSGSEEGELLFSKYCPPAFMYYENSPSALAKVIEQAKRERRTSGRCRQRWIIVDDLSDDPKIFKARVYRQLAMLGRHFNIFVMIAVHDACTLPIYIRNQVDYIFMLRTSAEIDIQRLHKFYAGMFPSLKQMRDTFFATTQNRGALVVHKTSTGLLHDSIFSYRAQTHGPFPIGSRAMFDYNAKVGKYPNPMFLQRLKQRRKRRSEQAHIEPFFPPIKRERGGREREREPFSPLK